MNNTKNISLSNRLLAVAGLAGSSDCVCDIGTDHGFVPIYLINSGAARHVIAMDINEGPLERAKEHIKEFGLENMIETRLSNGMEKLLAGEADTIICAGMGGLLMKRILEEGAPRDKNIKHMVLQPQSDLAAFREYLRQEKFFIEDEEEIFEDGKYYVAMRVLISDENENASYEKMISKICDISIDGCAFGDKKKFVNNREDAIRICDRFGPCLLQKKDETLRKYLTHEKSICESILLKLSEDEHGSRRHDIISKINDITTALSLY